MSRQNIDIGSAPNDGTGDVPRVAFDKVNDNFIELYSMFDDWPGDFDFWPLSGSAALTGNSEIDGDGNTLGFINLGGFSLDVGLNNMAFTGDVISIESTNAINWEVNDGVDQTDVDIDSVSFVISTVDTHFNNTNSFNVSVDDGVDSSSLTLGPDSFDLVVDGGTFSLDGGPTVVFGGDGFFYPYSALESFRINSTNGVILIDDTTLQFNAPYIDIRGTTVFREINPAEIQADVNNYNPGVGTYFNLTSDASRNITGWVPTIGDGDIRVCYNGGSFNIVFTHEDTNSTAANRFYVDSGAGNLTLPPGKSATWIYSAAQDRWRLTSYTG